MIGDTMNETGFYKVAYNRYRDAGLECLDAGEFAVMMVEAYTGRTRQEIEKVLLGSI